MKKIVIAFALLVLACTACQKDINEDLILPTLKTDSSSLSFSDQAGETDSFNIQSNVNWTITILPATADWLSISIDSGHGNIKVIVKTEKNNTADSSQKATLIISPVNNEHVNPVTVSVTQGKPTAKARNAFGGSYADNFLEAVQTPDGGYIAVGTTASNDGDISGLHGINDDVWIMKVDGANKKVWQKILGGTGRDFGMSIVKTPDGNYLIAASASTRDGDLTGLTGSGDWIIKIDGDGNIIWQKLIENMDDRAQKMIPATGGGYILVGSNDDCWVAKIDENANKIWEKSYGGNYYEGAQSVVPASGGGYIVVGSTQSIDGDIVGNHGSYDAVVFKIDENGNKVWLKCFGGSGGEFGNDIVKSSDGGYIINGGTQSNDGDVSGNHGNYDLWVLKIDANGNIIWQKALGGTGDEGGGASFIAQDGSLIIAGSATSTDGDVTGQHGDVDGWAVSLDTDGNKLWQKTLGGNDYDVLMQVLESSPGNYFAVGWTWSNNADIVGYNNDSDGWLMPFKK